MILSGCDGRDYHAAMLPEGFHWHQERQGPTIRYGSRVVAFGCEASPGGRWRLGLQGSMAPPRYVFLVDEAACWRYMDAWVRKWDNEIRKHGDQEFPLNACTGKSGTPSRPPTQTSHPRGKSRRRSRRL